MEGESACSRRDSGFRLSLQLQRLAEVILKGQPVSSIFEEDQQIISKSKSETQRNNNQSAWHFQCNTLKTCETCNHNNASM
jgi:hypothetical protein